MAAITAEPRHRRRRSPAWVAVLLALTPVAAAAQTWATEALVSASAIATSNGALAPEGQERSDLIGWLQPRLLMRGRGARFELDLDARVDLLGYTRGTQDNRALPGLNAALRTTLIDHALFLDASADVSQIDEDPYGVRVIEGSSGNTVTASAWRVRPYLDYALSARSSVYAAYEDAITRSGGNSTPDLRTRSGVARFEVKPLPVGFGLEASRLENDARTSPNQSLSNDAIRASITATVDGELVLGAIGGRERSRFLAEDREDTIYGVRIDWVPGPRTRLRGRVEQRFFGTGGELDLSHRTPFLALSARLYRNPTTATSVAAPIGGRAALGEFLDEILKTRIPDPLARLAAVSEISARLPFEPNPPSSIYIAAEYPQLQSGGRATLALLSPRNTVALSAYYETLRVLQGRDSSAPQPVLIDADSRQAGTSLELIRRLSPTTSAAIVARWSEIRGLEARDGDRTHEWSARLALSQQLSPRSTLSAGVQHRQIRSNIGGEQSYRETAALVGLTHRF